MRRFSGYCFAEAPECCAGEFSTALPLQYLRSARDKPHALFRCHIGVGDGLHQRERTRPHSSYIRRHFPGRCLCPMPFQ